MRYLLLAIAALALPACGGHDRTVGVPAPNEAELIVEVKNDDPVDYALWLEWQDERGVWQQEFLFAVYGDPYYGPTQEFSDLIVIPGVLYSILLADPEGNLYDVQTLWLSAGTLVDVHYHIVGGLLVWQP